MAILDDFGKKISNFGQSAVQKTKDVTDIARYNSAINAEEKNLAVIYSEIGKIYVQLHANSAEPELKNLVSTAVESQKKIFTLKSHLQETRKVLVCTSCGSEIPANSSFCNVCGSKVQVLSSSTLPCPSCGTMLGKDLKFCTFCGAKTNFSPEQILPINNLTASANCPFCGETIDGNMKFCTKCGKRIGQNHETVEPANIVIDSKPSELIQSFDSIDSNVSFNSFVPAVPAAEQEKTEQDFEFNALPTADVQPIPEPVVEKKKSVSIEKKPVEKKPEEDFEFNSLPTADAQPIPEPVVEKKKSVSIEKKPVEKKPEENFKFNALPTADAQPIPEPVVEKKTPEQDFNVFSASVVQPIPEPTAEKEKAAEEFLDAAQETMLDITMSEESGFTIGDTKPLEDPSVVEKVKCPQCGAAVEKSMMFCTSCGGKMNQKSAEKRKSSSVFSFPFFGKYKSKKPSKKQAEDFSVPDAVSINDEIPPIKNTAESDLPKMINSNEVVQSVPIEVSSDLFMLDYESEAAPSLGAKTVFAASDESVVYGSSESGNEVICDSCGKRMKSGAKFCIGCGSLLNNLKDKPKEKICPNCGSVMSCDMAFCTECGCRL